MKSRIMSFRDIYLPAALKGPRQMLRVRAEIFDFEQDLGLKLGQTKPKISGTVPPDRHTTIPIDSGPISTPLEDDPKLLNCEIAQPSFVRWVGGRSGPLSEAVEASPLP